jgi:hypothetical protein
MSPESEDGRVIAARFVEAGDKMGAAGPGRPGANAKPARELGLSGGRERRALLVTHADPFDGTAANRVRERIERIADQSENVFDPDLLKHADQHVRHRLGHLRLLWPVSVYSCT